MIEISPISLSKFPENRTFGIDDYSIEHSRGFRRTNSVVNHGPPIDQGKILHPESRASHTGWNHCYDFLSFNHFLTLKNGFLRYILSFTLDAAYHLSQRFTSYDFLLRVIYFFPKTNVVSFPLSSFCPFRFHMSIQTA